MRKEFYQLKMYPEESGIGLWVNTFISFHETNCYHYCVREHQLSAISSIFINDGETIAQSLKRRGIKFSRIHKTCSRKAFDTKEKAYRHFLLLKRKQLVHMQRDIMAIKEVLKFDEDKSFSDLEAHDNCFLYPDTQEFIASNYVFD